ncbi:MAG: hypothetical protein WC205_15990 [Opitutaceae bacterium]|jgi:hypothetical protein
MITSRISFLALGLVLAVSTIILPVRAAEAAAPQRVTLRVIAMDGMITDLAVRSATGRAALVARATAFTPDIDALALDGSVNFYRKISAPTPAPSPAVGGGAPVPDPLAASFQIEPGVVRYLVVVLAAGPVNQRSYRVYAVPDPEGALPAGSARIVNFTSSAMAVQLGTATSVVGVSGSAVLPCKPGEDTQVALRVAVSSGTDQWQLVSSTRLAVPAERRVLMFITPNAATQQVEGAPITISGGPISIKTVFDTVPPPAKPAVPGQF